jgi:hypothetical protein
MKCPEFERLVVLAEAEELSKPDREGLRDHARTCPHCAEFAQDMRAVEYLLKRERPQAPPEGFAAQVMARIRLVSASGETEADWQIRT